jgi:hypothetical protein
MYTTEVLSLSAGSIEGSLAVVAASAAPLTLVNKPALGDLR